ncbi:DNA polymerase epsilon subunit 3 [Ricinus communis]|uniref:DNA polymerase epsilon P17 subunit, putative n=1 Tax=Ricinus communis TaxID=3988 RepID=B9SCU4_RICCO|nr:DNA polymerase epsilon subunit 3 [Ricinus communis]EEF38539.1 DNA polymerase epsilon P17 subunit, putative [Ricinus communis]|eukprot:XP_002523813.1 DNA polymerase epsilon subunit 3 [Ricinus communis]
MSETEKDEKIVIEEKEKVEKVVPQVEELQKAIVRRLVKDKLSQCSPDVEFIIPKDSVAVFSETARIFIHYLSATANDICKEANRQTMNADDVFKALEEIEFSEFIRPLKASLNEFKQKTAGRKAGVSEPKEVEKKRKVEEDSLSKKSRGKSKGKKGK